jgi:hypothetical protein
VPRPVLPARQIDLAQPVLAREPEPATLSVPRVSSPVSRRTAPVAASLWVSRPVSQASPFQVSELRLVPPAAAARPPISERVAPAARASQALA